MRFLQDSRDAPVVSTRLPLLASTAVAVIFSAHYIVSKRLLASGVDPIAFAAFRGLLGGTILMVVFRRALWKALDRRFVRRVGLVSVFGFFLNQLCFMEGLKRTSAVNAALISTTIPVVSTALAVAVGLEQANAKRISAVGLGFAAVAVYLLHLNGWGTGADLVGDLLLAFNVIAFCTSLILAKRVLADVRSEAVVGLMLFLGGVMLGVVAARDMQATLQTATVDLEMSMLFLFSITGSTALVYALNYYALKRLPLSTASMFAFLQPIVTALLELAVFGRLPSVMLLPTVLAVSAATWFVSRHRSTDR